MPGSVSAQFLKNCSLFPPVPSMPHALICGFVHTAVLMNRLHCAGCILLWVPHSKFLFTFITSKGYKALQVFLCNFKMHSYKVLNFMPRLALMVNVFVWETELKTLSLWQFFQHLWYLAWEGTRFCNINLLVLKSSRQRLHWCINKKADNIIYMLI